MHYIMHYYRMVKKGHLNDRMCRVVDVEIKEENFQIKEDILVTRTSLND